jgi:hypothetical protein
MILALLDDPNGIAGGIVHRLGYAERIREAVLGAIESDGYSRSSRTPRR